MKSDRYQKVAKKLLRDAEGRKVLSELLGGAQIATRQELEEKAIVATLTPCYKVPEPDMTEGYVNMCDYARQHGITVYNGSSFRDSSVVHWSRNQLLGNLIKSKRPWTHVLYIDDDIVAPKDSLVKMVEHKKDIVGALCTRRQDPPIPTHRYWDEQNKNFKEILEWGTDECSERDGIGTGMLLISKHALEQVADVWFNCMYEKEVYGVSDAWVAKHREYRLARFDETGFAFWFDFLYHIDKCDSQYGEDMSFCILAKRYAKIPIYVDSTIQPGHIGKYAYSIQDFLPFRQQVLADYQNKLMAAAAMGKDLPEIAKPEQPKKPSGKVSVLIPSRGRPEQLNATVQSLKTNAENEIEVLVRFDDDDDEVSQIEEDYGATWKFGPRYGYEGLHKYYNELAEHATGDWLMIWNDDSTMKTKGWDTRIHQHAGGLKILNGTGKLNLFPVVSREVYQTLGHLSLQAHTDSWLQVIGRLTGIEENVDLDIEHTPRPEYTTSKEFFSPENFKLLDADVKKVQAALKAA